MKKNCDKQEKTAFKVGDRVDYLYRFDDDGNPTYIRGTIVEIDASLSADLYRVFFDDVSAFDKNDIRRKNNWWCIGSILSLVNKSAKKNNDCVKFTVTINKKTRETILEDDTGKKVTARCYSTDYFREITGVNIVINRYYYGFADGDTVYFINDGKVSNVPFSLDKSYVTNLLIKGNAFHTQEEAEEANKKIKAIFMENREKL